MRVSVVTQSLTLITPLFLALISCVFFKPTNTVETFLIHLYYIGGILQDDDVLVGTYIHT